MGNYLKSQPEVSRQLVAYDEEKAKGAMKE